MGEGIPIRSGDFENGNTKRERAAATEAAIENEPSLQRALRLK